MTSQHDVACRLIRRAARSAPPALAERLEEEWLADLACRTGASSRLRLAIGCWWATAVITRDFAVPQPVTSGAGGNGRALLGALHPDLPQRSRRTVTFMVIVAVHGLLIYGLTSGFVQHVGKSLPQATQGVVIQEAKPQRPPPPLPTVHIRPIPRSIDQDLPPPPTFEVPPDTWTGPGVRSKPEVPEGPPQPPSVSHRLPGGPGKGFPNSDDFYPASSRRLGETGATTVQVCVDTQGRLASDPVVTHSSGISRLDEGALKLAQAGSGHYRPTIENGQPVSACYPYSIRFRLND